MFVYILLLSAFSLHTSANKMNLLPSREYCGLQHSDDYSGNENSNVTRINEFPWLAGIVMKRKNDKGEEKEQVRCVGSLINRRYVLTAAHCLLSSYSKPVGVHLGEYDIQLQEDCVQEPPYEEECSEPLQVFSIEKIITHSDYNRGNVSNDIALIRLNKTAQYNDYVRPICLPFPGTSLAQVGDVLRSSGWGVNVYAQDKLTIKKRILSKLITNEECKTTFQETDKEKITENNICVIPLENTTDYSCRGDGGGPLIISKHDRWHQEGVYLFGKYCGTVAPYVYTKVVNYLDWILKNIEE